MPITTTIRIIIALAGQMGRPVPPSQYLLVNQTIYLGQLPPSDTDAFVLHATESGNTSEVRLSTAETEQLTTLLAQLPPHGMVSEEMSFDGLIYEMIVMQKEQPISFHWQNDNWRSSSPDSRPKWERVAALAAYALNLAQKKGATS